MGPTRCVFFLTGDLTHWHRQIIHGDERDPQYYDHMVPIALICHRSESAPTVPRSLWCRQKSLFGSILFFEILIRLHFSIILRFLIRWEWAMMTSKAVRKWNDVTCYVLGASMYAYNGGHTLARFGCKLFGWAPVVKESCPKYPQMTLLRYIYTYYKSSWSLVVLL